MGREGQERSKQYALQVFVGCCLMKFCTGGIAPNGTINIFLSYIAEDWQMDISSIALMNSIMCLVTMVMAPVMSRMMLKFSPKRVVQVSFFIGISGYLLCSLAKNCGWLYFCGGLVGIGNACLTYSALPFFINGWFRYKVGTFLGLSTVTQALGKLAFSPLCSHLITTVGWQKTYLIFGTLSCLIFLPSTHILLKDLPESMGMQPYSGNTPEEKKRLFTPVRGMPEREVYHTSTFWMLVFCTFIAGYCLSISTSVVAIVRSTGVLSDSRAGLANSAIALGMLVGEPALGRLFDRQKVYWKPVLLFCILQSAGMVMMANISVVPSLVLPVCLIIGMGIGATGTVMIPYVSRVTFGPKYYSHYYQRFVICISAANACSNYITNYIYDVTGSYSSILYVTSGISILIVIFIYQAYGRVQYLRARWI